MNEQGEKEREEKGRTSCKSEVCNSGIYRQGLIKTNFR